MSGIRRIFFNKTTGEIIQEVGRGEGMVIPTIEQDIATYTTLSERNRDTFDVIELAYGQLAQDFAECLGYSVDVAKLATLSEADRWKAIVFEIADPSNPEQPIEVQKPLTVQIDELNQESINTMLAVTEAYETQQQDSAKNEQDSIDSMLGLTDTYELVLQLQSRIEELETKLNS